MAFSEVIHCHDPNNIFPFFTPSDIVAQSKVVKGVVTDDKGAPLSGVNISIKDNTKAAISDNAGRYTITAGNNSTLFFSYVGFGTKEILVKSQTTVNVKLEAENKTLNDVVVVGYGTQKKVNVIGSVVTVGSKEITASPVSNLSNALAGRLPGAVIQQSSGEPGNNGATILIRGMATLGNNEPLVVIDGILGRDINSINPNDVESISILKDASAAIYGARAANGVILVTTKRGKEGSPVNVNYSFYQGFLSPTALPKMADAATYSAMIREMQTYGGVAEANMKFSVDDIQKYRSGKFPWTNPNTDWIDASFKKFSQTSSHNVAISGGNKAVNYYVSFGSQNEGGIFKNSSTSFNRYNIKASVDAKVNEYLTLGLDINGSGEQKLSFSQCRL